MHNELQGIHVAEKEHILTQKFVGASTPLNSATKFSHWYLVG
jgi:hypothetical protein